MEKITLGGERLGTGNKMQVELHGYGRSTHDLSYIWRSTMAAGTLVPFLSELALPGDSFDIDLDLDIKTHPTIGPLFGSYKAQMDVFIAPIRLYNGALHNNALNIGRDMSQIKLPKIVLEATKLLDADIPLIADFDNCQINPSCILAYLGIRGIGWVSDGGVNVNREFNAVPLLMYYEIYKNYYANKQEEIGAFVNTPIAANVTTVDLPNGFELLQQAQPALILNIPQAPGVGGVFLFNGEGLSDTIRIQFTGATPQANQIYILSEEMGWIQASRLGKWTTALIPTYIEMAYDNRFGKLRLTSWRYRNASDQIDEQPTVATFPLDNIDKMRMAILRHPDLTTFLINTPALAPYVNIYSKPSGFYQSQCTQQGLAIKTYQSDMFNNWLKTENINALNVQSAVLVGAIGAGTGFTIDALNISKKVWDLLNRINVSGGSYNDWQDAVWQQNRMRQSESPMYMGGLIKELVFQEVISNSESAGGQPLGTLAGRGILARKHKGGKISIKVDEPSYVMGIISLTPRVDYSQGNKWDTGLNTMDDLHKPQLDQIGFQDLITEPMAWWDTKWQGGVWSKKSAGKQPAWINYMTNVNRNYGNFAIKTNEMFMTLNRRYDVKDHLIQLPTIKDLTSYIDPAKFNFIFAETQLDAQNFWVQIAVDMIVRRKMSAKVMPNI